MTTRESNAIPESLPLNTKANKYFHELRVKDNLKLFRDLEDEISQTVNQIIDVSNSNSNSSNTTNTNNTDTHSKDIEVLIQDLNNSYNDLIKEESIFANLDRSLLNAKEKFRYDSQNCESININNWQKYQQKSRDINIPERITTLLQDQIQQNSEVTKINPNTRPIGKLLRTVKYIWNDPTAVIPDEEVNNNNGNNDGDDNDDDEEDLQIEGGNIELVCPITCKTYEDPMISKACGHIFDKEGLINYLKTSRMNDTTSKRDCPQAGCGKVVCMADFESDPIMKLRCRIALKQKENEDNRQNAEELDVL